MKTTTTISALIISLISASSAFAAKGGLEDNSGFFVWMFLGFCALIVVAQVVPAALLMLGFAKGIASEKVAKPHAEAGK